MVIIDGVDEDELEVGEEIGGVKVNEKHIAEDDDELWCEEVFAEGESGWGVVEGLSGREDRRRADDIVVG